MAQDPLLVYEKHPEVVSRKVVDEVFLLPIRQPLGESQDLHMLSPVAARIWETIDGERDLQAIGELIAVEFDVEAEEAQQDLADFVGELEALGLVRRVDKSTDHGGGEAADEPS